MVFVIVEIAQEDIGDIVTRLLGARHKIQVVEDLQTACGCGSTQVKRKVPQPVVASRTSPALNAMDLLSNDALGIEEQEKPSFQNEETRNIVNFVDDSMASSSHQMTPRENLAFVGNNTIPKNSYSASRRNNGVPYNSGILYPQIRKMDGTDEEPKEDYPEGIDMAIKCALCDRTIALGTRPANHSTRKYAHARCHGFKNRFECNLCHAVFKNKRVTVNHNRTVHNDNPNFEVVDKWNEAAQRELMVMVRKCFPKDNRPFMKTAMSPLQDDEDTMEDVLVKDENDD